MDINVSDMVGRHFLFHARRMRVYDRVHRPVRFSNFNLFGAAFQLVRNKHSNNDRIHILRYASYP